jgi:Protein of unknown function (DUF3800)
VALSERGLDGVGFFDESGEHASRSDGGQLIRLTLGGCWAEFDDWSCFVNEWGAVLSAHSINEFHAADFFSYNGEFCGWDSRRDEHRALLNSLLDVIIKYVPELVGFSLSTPRGNDDFVRTYEANLSAIISNSQFQSNPAIVLARHKNYSAKRISEVVEATEGSMSYIGFKIKTWTISSPKECCPLQAADLVAYELARFAREKEFNRPMRYPLRRLHQAKSIGWLLAT